MTSPTITRKKGIQTPKRLSSTPETAKETGSKGLIPQQTDLRNWFVKNIYFLRKTITPFVEIYSCYRDSCVLHGALPYGRNVFGTHLRAYVKEHGPSGVKVYATNRVFYSGVGVVPTQNQETPQDSAPPQDSAAQNGVKLEM